MARAPRPPAWRACLELVRPPNVATALADVLAGFAVAGLGARSALPWLLASTACLYAGGIVLNDVCDREIDARERPERPIPSGRVTIGGATLLGAGLLAAGVAAAAVVGHEAAIVAGALAAAVLIYDSWGKRHAVVGPLNMGLCRGLNLVLGMTAVPGVAARAWPLGLLPLAYIWAVTMVSRGEVQGGRRSVGSAAFAAISAVVLALILLAATRAEPIWPPLVFVAWLAARVLPAFWVAAARPSPDVIRRAVRTGVLSLVLLDAVIAAVYAGMIYSLALVATALIAGRLARVFAVT